MLEIGICSDTRKALIAGLVIPVGAMLLTLVGEPTGRVTSHFLGQYMDLAGPPLLLAAVLAVGFYAYAWHRKVKEAEWGVVVALLGLSVTGSETLSPATMAAPRVLPLLVGIAILILWRGV